MPLQLLPGEGLIKEGIGRGTSVWLTNQRLVKRAEAGTFRKSRRTVSIPLEHINSVEVRTFNNRLFVLLAGLSLILIAAYPNLWTIVVSTLLAGLFILMFYGSRHVGVQIMSTTSTIEFHSEGLSIAEMEKFVNEIEAAKQLKLRKGA